MVKFCPKCGNQNPDEAVACLRCGFDFRELNQQQAQPTPNQPIIQPNPSPFNNLQQPLGNQYYGYNRSIGVTLGAYANKITFPGGILFGIAIILFSVGYILFIIASSGNSISAPVGVYIGALSMYIVLGIFSIIMFVSKNRSYGKIFVMGIIGMLYMILNAVTMFMIYSEFKSFGVSGVGYLLDSGILQVISAVFLLVGIILMRSMSIVTKMVGTSFGLVSLILYYVGITTPFSTLGNYSNIASYSSFAGILSQYQFYINYFSNLSGIFTANSEYYLGLTAGIIFVASLFILPFSKSITLNNVVKLIQIVSLVLFSIGVLVLGASIVSGGLPNTSGETGTAVASSYISFTASVIDIVSGILLMIGSIFYMVNVIMNMVNANKQYQPQPYGSSGSPPYRP